MTTMDKDLLVPGARSCSTTRCMCDGVLMNDMDPLVIVMKMEKAPQENLCLDWGVGQSNPGNEVICGVPLRHPEYH